MSNHVIYDRIWVSQKLSKCSLKAALAYPWIYLVADDWGRFEYLPRVIWGRAFGARQDVRAGDVAAWLGEYERVGLLETYEAEGRRVGAWTNFSGPPPSKRRAPTLPDRNGCYEEEGFNTEKTSRFAARAVRNPSLERERERELELEQEREGGTGTQEPEPEPRPSRSPVPDLVESTTLEISDLAQELAEQTRTEPRAWIVRASEIPASTGRPARSFEDPRSRGLPLAWLQTTARKLREIRDEARRPPPL